MLMDQLHSPLGGVVAIVCSGLCVVWAQSEAVMSHFKACCGFVSHSWWYANTVKLSNQELSMSEWVCAE